MALTPKQGSTLVTVTEAAKAMDCTTSYLRRLLRGNDPRLVGERVGPRVWLIDSSCLEQFRSQLTSRSRGKRPQSPPAGKRRKRRKGR